MHQTLGAGLALVLVALVYVLVDAHRERRARRAWEHATSTRIGGHDAQLGTLGRAVGLLAPPDARPTTAHRQGMAARIQLPPPTEAVAVAPVSRSSPRIRVEIHPSGFRSDRVIYFSTVAWGESLLVDARDVDEREGTVDVEVIDAASRADEVLVAFPPERVLRGQRVWLPRALVLDIAAAHPSSPRLAIDMTGDRAGLNPGDAPAARTEAAEEAPLSMQTSSAADAEEKVRLRREADAEADARDRARAVADAPPSTMPSESQPRGVAPDRGAAVSDAVVIATFASACDGAADRESDEHTHLYSRKPVTSHGDRVTPTAVSPVLAPPVRAPRAEGDAQPPEGTP
jgi:hypothetical protein